MSYNLTMGASPTPTYTSSAQKYGSAALLTGYGYDNSQSVIPNYPFTAQGWLKTTSTTNFTVAFGHANVFWVGNGSGGVIAKYGTSGSGETTLSSATSIADGNWHHVRFEMTSTGCKLYVDGVMKASSATTPTTANVNYTTANYKFSIGGLYIGGISSAWNGSIDEVAIFNTVAGAAYTPVQVQPTDAGLVALYALDGNGNNTAASSSSYSSITPDNAAFAFSPYNWLISSAAAKTISSGAYFKINFTGTTCILNFDLMNNGSPLSQVWTKVDNGAWTSYVIGANISLTIPGDNSWATHKLHVVVKSTSETINRWASPQNTAVVFSGIMIDAGASVSAPNMSTTNVLFYGDSITEGVRTLSANTNVTDTFRNDVFETWNWKVAVALGGEFGIVGFGGIGINVSGSGNVPNINNSYNQLWNGQSRSFATPPSLVIINLGTNDATNAITTQATTMLNNILAACPGARIAVLRPFGGQQAANLQSAIAACNNPANCTYVDTTGFFVTSMSADGTHPYGIANERIAKLLLPPIKQIIAKTYPSGFIGV